MEQIRTRRLHVARAADWMDAVITVLEPRSPYRPRHHGPVEARPGDTVVFVLDTDPSSILTEVAQVGTDGDLRSAVFDRTPRHATLMDLTTVATLAGLESRIAESWSFEDEDAEKLESVLEECRVIDAPSSRFGHTSVAAARTLLRFCGLCDGCNQAIDLTGPDARDRLFVHTVDPYGRPAPADTWSVPDDWPAVMCRRCLDRMHDMGYTSFVDFKFALHPPCPACGALRTCATFYGMPSDHWNIEPWSHAGGCCVSTERWCCSVCRHQW